MRTLDVRCDNCGKTRPANRRPRTWYLLEEQSEVMRNGPSDFCSLKCLNDWTADPDVLAHAPDLPEPPL